MGTNTLFGIATGGGNRDRRRTIKRHWRRVLVATLLLFVASNAIADNKLVVFAVNYPLAYFAQRIGGDDVQVQFPVPAGVDPAFWMPDVAQVIAYQQADLILLNGARYAKWVDKVSLPQLKLVNTSVFFEEQYIRGDAGATHSHGPAGEHSHGGVTFTTWLDFSLAAQQAQAITEALARVRPEMAADFERRFAILRSELLELDSEMQSIGQRTAGKPLLASHPVYQYLRARYGLNLRSVMWEPDVVPDQASWVALQQLTNEHPARWMLWESEPLSDTQQRLTTLGISSLVFSPCANVPDEGDFLSVMRANLEALSSIFGPGG
ncbi:MAG: zinc ABC transporter substrate-binding protein [Betaproteobacteria bacterium]|nr:MAG: zinc ABC transporter substrate-binding protein [Betaproteobacteria bacterium]